MKALVFGAGKIARGFVAQLLRMNEVDVVFVEKVPQLVEQLNEAGSYEVHILGNEALNTRVDGYRAICLDDVDAIAAEMRDAGRCVIGGFQSSLERDVLKLLLRGQSPIVMVLVRSVWRTVTSDLRNGHLWRNVSDVTVERRN